METSTPERSSKKRHYQITTVVLLLLSILTIRWLITDSYGMTVTFHNSSTLLIESINLDFGNNNSQSTIRAFRIPAGQERVLLLNHEPGLGFNVEVNYKGGIKQSFCALRGDEQTDPTIYLRP